jgi:hypothetical protein
MIHITTLAYQDRNGKLTHSKASFLRGRKPNFPFKITGELVYYNI